MPKRSNPWIVLSTAAVAALLLLSLTLSGTVLPQQAYASSPLYFKDLQELQAFVSDNTQLASLLEQNAYSAPFAGGVQVPGVANQGAATAPAPAPNATSASGNAPQEDYSTTNNQVAGVDEADIVKSDGSYLYIISGQKVDIAAAYPPESAAVVSSVYGDGQPLGLFVDGNMLAVIANQEPVAYPMSGGAQPGSLPMVSSSPAGSGGPLMSGATAMNGASGAGSAPAVNSGPVVGSGAAIAPGIIVRPPIGYPPPVAYPSSSVGVSIYDTTDKSNPVLKYQFSIPGASYVDSRLIGDYVYLIANAPLNQAQPEADGQGVLQLPQILEGNGSTTSFPATAVQHFDLPYSSYRYTMIEAINMEALTRKTSIFLTGGTQDVFVSSQNIYLTSPAPVDLLSLYQKYINQLADKLPAEVAAQVNNAIDPNATPSQKLEQAIQAMGLVRDNLAGSQDPAVQQILENLDQEIRVASDQTLVQKFQADGYDATYQAQATVPGQVLNQFSMDEYDGYFRVATTTRDPQQWSNSENNVFVYGPDLQLAGSLANIAPGEQIYSARFLGSRAYLVTFQQLDPFFVVDLSDPAAPKVLGDLKIPGFSDYLQPYDDNHIIGIGKDTTPNLQENGMPIPGGLKIALFDVTNPAQPVELSRYELPAGSDSEALYDHKALLFSLSKHLLALPVTSSVLNQPAPAQPAPTQLAPTQLAPAQLAPAQPYYGYWQGAYIFNISLDQGITLRGTIDHTNPAVSSGQPPVSGSGGQNAASPGGAIAPSTAPSLYPVPILPPVPVQPYGYVRRILYIDNVLYTVSDSMLKLNSLDSLAELKALTLLAVPQRRLRRNCQYHTQPKPALQGPVIV